MDDLLVLTVFIKKVIEPGKKYLLKPGMTLEFRSSRQLCGDEPVSGKKYDLYCGANNTAAFLPVEKIVPKLAAV